MRTDAVRNLAPLVLGHFSSRYSNEQTDEAIEWELKRNEIKISAQPITSGEIAHL
ncbi:MAG: hypothetical protein ACI87E_000344 [Mariniblastus sp.]|jgi:hypothetical protein